MKIFFIFIFVFLTSCSTFENKKNFSFSEKMTIEEFKIQLEEYANISPYPNIDN